MSEIELLKPKITKQNWRVVIDVPQCHFYNDQPRIDKWSQEVADSIKASVKRHVDDIDQVYVEYDTMKTCPLCGYDWELDDDDIPACCSAQQEAGYAANPGVKP